MKKILLLLLSITILFTGCNVNKSEKQFYTKEEREMEIAKAGDYVEKFLHDKYGRTFEANIADNPNFLYKSYYFYIVCKEDNSTGYATAAYIEDGLYSVTDNYLKWYIMDDLENWMSGIVSSHFQEFKVIFKGSGGLSFPSSLDGNSTLEETLELLKTEYLPLGFTILLKPTEAKKYDIEKELKKIATELKEKGSRVYINVLVYEDEGVYEKINSYKDEQHYWSTLDPRDRYGITVRSDYTITDIQKSEMYKN